MKMDVFLEIVPGIDASTQYQNTVNGSVNALACVPIDSQIVSRWIRLNHSFFNHINKIKQHIGIK